MGLELDAGAAGILEHHPPSRPHGHESARFHGRVSRQGVQVLIPGSQSVNTSPQ